MATCSWLSAGSGIVSNWGGIQRLAAEYDLDGIQSCSREGWVYLHWWLLRDESCVALTPLHYVLLLHAKTWSRTLGLMVLCTYCWPLPWLCWLGHWARQALPCISLPRLVVFAANRQKKWVWIWRLRRIGNNWDGPESVMRVRNGLIPWGGCWGSWIFRGRGKGRVDSSVSCATIFGFGLWHWDRNRGSVSRLGGFGGGRALLGPDPIPYSWRHFASKVHISSTFMQGSCPQVSDSLFYHMIQSIHHEYAT